MKEVEAYYKLTEFGVNVPGCRYIVRPCGEDDPGAEEVLRSEAGLLLTDKHELRSVCILPFDGEFVTVTTVQ